MTMGIDFSRVFRVIPYNAMLLRANAPVFTIVEVTDLHLQTLGQPRSALIGRGLFDAFPLSDNNINRLPLLKNNINHLYESFLKVAETDQTHKIPHLRYDILEEGELVEKHWSIENVPYKETDNRRYIINFALDITDVYKAGFFKNE